MQRCCTWLLLEVESDHQMYTTGYNCIENNFVHSVYLLLEFFFSAAEFNLTLAERHMTRVSVFKHLKLDGSDIGGVGPRQTWEKVNIKFNDNGTISYQMKKVFVFDPENSIGSEDDMVVIPNIPMLSATSQSKHAARFLRLAMASIMDILKIKPFVEVSVGQLLWGYEDPLLKLAKDVVPKEQKLPYEEFGLMYGKNGTAKDIITVFSGSNDITRLNLIERFNGFTHLAHWKTESCNRLNGSDGSLFPPHITKNTTLYVYEKDLCRLLPLRFEKEVERSGGVPGYRFTPPADVFADRERNPENDCFCPAGPPCAPHGLFNVSLCQYDSPILVSFPHFYMADPKLREAVDGMSEPDPEKHQLYIDIQPVMGVALRAKARIQINLAVSQVVDIKQVATFPDIVFPIMWFEDGIEELPSQVTDLLSLATKAPPVAKSAISYTLFVLGTLLFVLSLTCIIRSSSRQESLNLEGTSHYVKPEKSKNGHSNGINPAFESSNMNLNST
ncbi:hypothetical protein RUM43_001467 [Polyplax serrata]|uniref:Scavenger receptor class B member 1 n=1 Tax=Polyplax serrata TaxID=468196 RepID=A0AAN8XS64_POLSC